MRGVSESGCGIGEAGQGVGLVGLDADHDALVHAHFDPHAEANQNGHAHRVGLPVAAVDAGQFAAVGNDLGGAGNRRAVFAPHIAGDTRILSRPLDLIRISGSEEFDLSVIHSQPDLDFLQFAGGFVGAEPLGVTFEGALEFWSHRLNSGYGRIRDGSLFRLHRTLVWSGAQPIWSESRGEGEHSG